MKSLAFCKGNIHIDIDTTLLNCNFKDTRIAAGEASPERLKVHPTVSRALKPRAGAARPAVNSCAETGPKAPELSNARHHHPFLSAALPRFTIFRLLRINHPLPIMPRAIRGIHLACFAVFSQYS